MVISIAMLGIGASGAALSLYPALKSISRTGFYGLLLGLSITASYVAANQLNFDPVRLSWDRMQILYICLYYVFLSVPFFFFGLLVSTVLSEITGRTGLLYGSDLLGAGTGSLCLLYFMSIMCPEKCIVLISCIALTASLVIGAFRIRILCAVIIAFNIFLLTMPDLIAPRMSPYKGLQVALRYPGAEHIKTYNGPFSRVDVFKSPAARFAPGLSVKYLEPLPEQLGLSIDGADLNAVTPKGVEDSFEFLNYIPSALPYEIAEKDDILILEPKGGFDVLLAKHYGAKSISKVDSNPLVVKMVRDIDPGVYDERTWTAIGRSWLRKRDDKFDIIDIPLLGTSPAGSFGIDEDYRFTVEAFKEYLRHLKENGLLSIHLFILPPPRTELRLLGTLVVAMEESGIREPHRNIIALRSWGTVCIISKNIPFNPGEVRAAREFAERNRFDLLYYPGIKEEETNVFVRTPTGEYFLAFSSILRDDTRGPFQRGYIFDIRPVHDENPFFHYYFRLSNLKKIYETMGAKWQYFIEEGYLLPAVLAQVMLLSVVLMILPASSRRLRSGQGITPFFHLLYFAFLGIGFMFVEITLIHKTILPLENPSYAITSVITAILISSGSGSMLSNRYPSIGNRSATLAVALLILAYSFFMPSIFDAVSSGQLSVKIALISIILMPLGLLMGIPFPLGLRNLGAGAPQLIPWAWAVNGCMSVLAPLAAIMLAMSAGFKTVLWFGAAAYFLAFVTFPSSESNIRAERLAA